MKQLRHCVCDRGLTSLVATSNSVSMTDSMGLMSKSEGAPLGGSKRRPLGSWSLCRENTAAADLL